MLRRRATFILTAQSILFLAHAFVYETWSAFWRTADPPAISRTAMIFFLLSLTFLTASLMAFRFDNTFVRAFYAASAVWLGALNYFFLTSIVCWIVYAGAPLAGLHWQPRDILIVLFGVGALATAYGVVNASLTRVERIDVTLPNLPEAWRGRTAALLSDTHLGSVRAYGFSQRIVSKLNQLKPDVVFLAGDVYDGTAADVNLFAKPFGGLSAPLGAYFVTGNHEEFTDRTRYIDALRRAGVRVLQNEKAVVDGVQILGVFYHELTTPERFRAALRQTDLDRAQPSILLAHAPSRLPEAEAAGISLQLCGHTHAGQFFPWTHVVSRIYGKFAYGLQKLGNMMVYTSCGAGTWGPPMRLGTNPEIVLIRFNRNPQGALPPEDLRTVHT